MVPILSIMSRKEAFKSAMLNTVLRLHKDEFPDLILSKTTTDKNFKRVVKKELNENDLFMPVEPLMESARVELIKELR